MIKVYQMKYGRVDSNAVHNFNLVDNLESLDLVLQKLSKELLLVDQNVCLSCEKTNQEIISRGEIFFFIEIVFGRVVAIYHSSKEALLDEVRQHVGY